MPTKLVVLLSEVIDEDDGGMIYATLDPTTGKFAPHSDAIVSGTDFENSEQNMEEFAAVDEARDYLDSYLTSDYEELDEYEQEAARVEAAEEVISYINQMNSEP